MNLTAFVTPRKDLTFPKMQHYFVNTCRLIVSGLLDDLIATWRHRITPAIMGKDFIFLQVAG